MLKFKRLACGIEDVTQYNTIVPKAAISQIMKSQRRISNELQYKAKQDLISISKKILYG